MDTTVFLALQDVPVLLDESCTGRAYLYILIFMMRVVNRSLHSAPNVRSKKDLVSVMCCSISVRRCLAPACQSSVV